MAILPYPLLMNLRIIILAGVLSLGAASGSHAGQVLLSDNFTADSSVNPSLWQTILPFSDSYVGVTQGTGLVMGNRGQLLSQGGFPTNLDLTMSFEFTGNPFDSFKIATQTNGVSTNGSREFDNGIFVSFRMMSDPSDPAGTTDNITIFDQDYPNYSTPLATGTFAISEDTPVVVQLLEDDGNISLFLDGSTSPFLTAYSPDAYGDQIGFYGREGAGGGSGISAGTQETIQYVTVSGVPDSGLNELEVFLVLFGLCFLGHRSTRLC